MFLLLASEPVSMPRDPQSTQRSHSVSVVRVSREGMLHLTTGSQQPEAVDWIPVHALPLPKLHGVRRFVNR